MTATTTRIRFCENDFSDAATITATGSVSGYSYTNASNQLRSRVWKPAGSFIVTTSNYLLYINDGSNKTVTLTTGTYTYSTLASHIQTKLNTASSGWTVTYDTSGSTYKFTIARSSSATLRLSQTTTSAWDMLGYTSGSDIVGTSFVAEEQRNHTQERYIWDFGIQMTPTAFFAIGPRSETFCLSNGATARLMFNNVNTWDSPALTVNLTIKDDGIAEWLDSQSDTTYRYACFEIIDRTNPLGPTGLKIGRLWLGDYTTVTTTNVATGFSKTLVDPSEVAESIGGGRYFNRRTKYRTFKNLSMQNMDADERRTIEQLFSDIGRDQSFFVSIDPYLSYSDDFQEFTFYANFEGEPQLKHLIRDIYTMDFELREAL